MNLDKVKPQLQMNSLATATRMLLVGGVLLLASPVAQAREMTQQELDSAFFDAMVNRNLTEAEEWLQKGASPNGERFGTKFVIYAGGGCNLKDLKLLQKHGVDMSATDGGRTILEIARDNMEGADFSRLRDECRETVDYIQNN